MPENSSVFTGEINISEDFSIPKLRDWETLAKSGLRGIDPESLCTDLPEGIRTRVLYTPEDTATDPGEPGSPPYIRARTNSHPPWTSCSLIDSPDIVNARKTIDFALSRDATALWLQCADSKRSDRPGLTLETLEDSTTILKGINPGEVEILLDAGSSSAQVTAGFLAACEKLGIDFSRLRGSFGFDPMGLLASTGSLPGGLDHQRRITADLALWAKKHCPGMRTLCLSSLPFAGASAVEELGVLLASSLDALRFLSTAGMELEKAASSILYRMSIGRDFFVGIAKFRAMRMLWASMSSHCGLERTMPPPIHAVTSQRELTRRDPWVNLLRGSVETFAAIAGGADLITTRSYDSAFLSKDTLGRRLALNTQTILREESHLGRIVDPGGGSWYIESLTRKLAESAWSFFREIETEGGIKHCLLSGMIQERIEMKEKELMAKVSTREIPITGVSTWALPQKEIPPKRETRPLDHHPILHVFRGHDWVPEAIQAALTGIAPRNMGHSEKSNEPLARPLDLMRRAEAFEDLQDRAATLSMTNHDCRVLLLRLGKTSDFTARERFSINFFAAASLETMAIGGFETAETAVNAVKGTGLSYVCLCSSDPKYEQLVSTLLPMLKDSGLHRIFLAGNPGEMESEWHKLGLDDCIFQGCNVLDFLSRLLETMEVD